MYKRNDDVREVRQSALLLLSYSSEATAEQALWNYLPFAKMQCLHTLTEFNLDCYKPEQHHPYYFAIADYNNTLICYWDLSYKQSFVNIWHLETGQSKKDFDLAMAHEFGLGKSGKVCIISFQDFLWPLDTETQEPIGTYPDYLMGTVQSILQGHTAPIGYVAMSGNREFIASYSIDRKIKIWAVPESLRYL